MMFADIPTPYLKSDCNTDRRGSGRRDCADLKPGDIINFPLVTGKQPCQITCIQTTAVIPGVWVEVITPNGSLEMRWFPPDKTPKIAG